MSRRTSWRVAAVAGLAGACLTGLRAGARPTARSSSSRSPCRALRATTPTTTRRRRSPACRPAQIVTGFLDAMTATPLQTSAAVKYLTTPAARSGPRSAASSPTPGSGRLRAGRKTVRVRLRGAERIGAGRSVARTRRPGRVARLTFPMRVENGEWRIAVGARRPAGAAHLLRRRPSRTPSLYFFDPTGADPGPRGRAHAAGTAAHHRAGPRPPPRPATLARRGGRARSSRRACRSKPVVVSGTAPPR